MDCFFISFLCSLFYFYIFNNDTIIVNKNEIQIFEYELKCVFHSKTKFPLTLTFEKHECKPSKISSLIIPIYNNSVFFPYLFPLTHMILKRATLMNPLMFYMIN